MTFLSSFSRRLTLLLSCCLVSLTLCAQSAEYRAMHQGNRAFLAKDYARAEQCYRAALKANPSSVRAHFNLGDAFLAQNNAKSAMQEYAQVAERETNKTVKAMALHNIGYIHHTQKQYDQAIDYYKRALRLNPHDADTRYNLALCQKMQRQQNKDNQQNQQKQQNQQQNQQQNKSQDQQHNQQKQQQQSRMSDDNAQQLLNLSRQAERQTQEKVKRAKRPRPRQLEKNW